MPAHRLGSRKSITSSERRTEFERGQDELRELTSHIPVSDERGRDQRGPQCNHHEATLRISQRVEELEQAATKYETLQTRLVTIEGLLKPYAAYEEYAIGAVKQLQEIEKRLQTGRFSKTDTAIKQLVEKHEASLQEHSTRLQQLLDQNELVRDQPQSTADLAKSLLYRLTQGDLLDDKLASTLCERLSGTGKRGRQELTPVTEDTDTNCDTEDSVETPRQPTESRPSKRLRMSGSSSSATTPATRSTPRQPTSRSSKPSALDSFKSGTLTEDRRSMESEQDTTSSPESEEHSDLPRSARKRQPPTRNPDMVHWKEVTGRRKHSD